MGKKKALEQTVYDFVEDKIKAKDWLPKQHIKEMDVAKALDISRTPIRGAFKRLEADGILKIVPYKGAEILEPEIDSSAFQERTNFLEVLVSYHFQTLELDEVDFDTDGLKEIYGKMAEEKFGDQDLFEEREVDFWHDLLQYCHNSYMRGMMLDTLRYILPKTGHLKSIIQASRDKKLKHYQFVIDYLEDNNYPYVRREFRILFNQLNMNVIQGV